MKTVFQKCQRESILILFKINNDTAKTTKVSELYLGFKKMMLLNLTNDAK